MMKLISENKTEIKKIDNEVNRLVVLTNSTISEMVKLNIQPTKTALIELMRIGAKRFLQDKAMSTLKTNTEGLKEESVRNMLDIPNYNLLLESMQKLQKLSKYFDCIDIVKGVAKLNQVGVESHKDKYRNYARTQEEIEVVEILEDFKEAFNTIDKRLKARRGNGLLIHSNFNWRSYFFYDHYSNGDRFTLNHQAYNYILGR